jgi:Sugar (pentulose and hexulose) kinases
MQYLTVDIGASSGKILKGHLENNALKTEEVYRFPNVLVKKGGHLVWDLESLASHVLSGLEKAGSADCVAIDTWGVDFVLLDENNKLVSEAVSYRDGRTKGIASPVLQEELYKRTGIQKQEFNTIYQLLALKKEAPAELEKAQTLLMIPDYLAFLLTGEIHQEYTNATTTNLVNAKTRTWDYELIRALGLPEKLFCPLSMPGSRYGFVTEETENRIGYRPMVLAAPSHDTASAVIGSPLTPSSAFLSSGTWSLFGTLISQPLLSKEAERANFTNEGGLDGSIRLLKNLMGTWILQNIRKEWDNLPFDEIERLAKEGADCPARFDITDYPAASSREHG